MAKRDFIALAAPSGAGKTTLCNRLLAAYPKLALSISFTTRAPRGSEKNGVEYHFVAREEFQGLIGRGELIEWAEVHGNFYGTSRIFLEQQVKSGRVVLLDIDVQGVASLKSAFGDRCLSVFILPPSFEELEKRLRGRGTDSEAVLQKRLANARSEMAQAGGFDYRVVNKELDSAFAELSAIVESEARLAE